MFTIRTHIFHRQLQSTMKHNYLFVGYYLAFPDWYIWEVLVKERYKLALLWLRVALNEWNNLSLRQKSISYSLSESLIFWPLVAGVLSWNMRNELCLVYRVLSIILVFVKDVLDLLRVFRGPRRERYRRQYWKFYNAINQSRFKFV